MVVIKKTSKQKKQVRYVKCDNVQYRNHSFTISPRSYYTNFKGLPFKHN